MKLKGIKAKWKQFTLMNKQIHNQMSREKKVLGAVKPWRSIITYSGVSNMAKEKPYDKLFMPEQM